MSQSVFRHLLVFSALLTFSCAAEIIDNVKYDYYPVDIKENQKYYHATTEASPLGMSGNNRKIIGMHSWQIRWRMRTTNVKHNNWCKIDKFIVYLEATISLPELTTSVSEKQAREFNYYAELIHQHELEHHYITRAYAERFEQRVLNEVGGVKDCSQLDGKIQDIYKQVMYDHKEQQLAFDERDGKISKIKQIERLLYG